MEQGSRRVGGLDKFKVGSLEEVPSYICKCRFRWRMRAEGVGSDMVVLAQFLRLLFLSCRPAAEVKKYCTGAWESEEKRINGVACIVSERVRII